MVIHTQAIRRLLPTNCLSVFDHFVGLALKGLSNRDNVRAPIQFKRESQSQLLKRCFFFKNSPNDYHINSTRVIRPVKRNKLSFSSIEIKNPKAISSPNPQCLVDQIQVQKPILVVALYHIVLL